MPRDYAAPRRKKKQASPLPGRVYLLMGLVPGLALAGWLWFKPTAAPTPGEVPASTADEGLRPAVQEPRFTFYHELPAHKRDSSGRSAPPPPAASAPPPKPAPSQRYAVQAGSYQQAQQADEQKAKLAMLGVSARVEAVKLDAESTFYRVRVGPYDNRASADQMLAELTGNSIDAAVIVLP